MAKYRHIIWDWNGTLWDDSCLCFEITNKMLAERNMPLMTQEYYRSVMRFPIRDYYSDLGFDFSVEPYESLAHEFIELYDQRKYDSELREGAVEVLSELKKNAITQSVLSAYKQDSLDEALRHYGLHSFFDSVIGLSDIYASSKVENGKQYIKKLGLELSEVLFIGDTEHDFETASAMCIDSVLIESGHTSRVRLEKCLAPVFNSLYEIKNYILG